MVFCGIVDGTSSISVPSMYVSFCLLGITEGPSVLCSKSSIPLGGFKKPEQFSV
jgi:hypothetical protein